MADYQLLSYSGRGRGERGGSEEWRMSRGSTRNVLWWHPSIQDSQMTKELIEAGKLMGIEVLDQVIIRESVLFVG